jgi:hypothetical protein
MGKWVAQNAKANKAKPELPVVLRFASAFLPILYARCLAWISHHPEPFLPSTSDNLAA